MSNYPPGVSGSEFAIAGPDFEDDAVEECGYCGALEDGLVQGYRGDRWFICDRCCQTTDLEDGA